MATQSVLRSRSHRSKLVLLGLATLGTTLIIGSLLWRAALASAPTAPQPIPAPAADRPAANRFFADEISAGAGTAEWTLPEVPATLPRHGPH